MSDKHNAISQNDRIQVEWPIQFGVVLDEENSRFCNKLRASRWKEAVVQSVRPDITIVILYSACDIFPGSVFYATVRQDTLVHFAEKSSILLQNGFASFSLPWRRASPRREASVPHRNCPYRPSEKAPMNDTTTYAAVDASVDEAPKWEETNMRINDIERLLSAQISLFSTIVGDPDPDIS